MVAETTPLLRGVSTAAVSAAAAGAVAAVAGAALPSCLSQARCHNVNGSVFSANAQQPNNPLVLLHLAVIVSAQTYTSLRPSPHVPSALAAVFSGLGNVLLQVALLGTQTAFDLCNLEDASEPKF